MKTNCSTYKENQQYKVKILHQYIIDVIDYLIIIRKRLYNEMRKCCISPQGENGFGILFI